MALNLNRRGLTKFPEIPITDIQVQIENNQLTEIPSSIGTLINLSYFYLRNNKINSIPKEKVI